MKLEATIYVKNSFEAVGRYKEAFGLTLGYHVIHDENDIGQHFFHAELSSVSDYSCLFGTTIL